MVDAQGFAGTPVTKYLLLTLLTTSLLANLTDSTHLLPLLLEPHLLAPSTPSSGYITAPPLHLWRLLTYALAYGSRTEILFGGLAVYNLRGVERLWGSRKFLSFILQTLPWTILTPPLLLLFLRPLMPSSLRASLNYVPPGPTGLVFALLAQYQAAVPYSYRYVANTGEARAGRDGEGREEGAVVFTSKSTSYLLPAQLALSQLPGSAVTAFCGWCVGWAWRRGMVPGGMGWRIG